MTEHAVKDGEKYNTFEEWADAVIRAMCCIKCYSTMTRNTRGRVPTK